MTDLPDNARGRLLAAANDCVNVTRNVAYGDPNSDFGRMSKYWNIHIAAVLERKLMALNLRMDPALQVVVEEVLDTWDVAVMMEQVKHSRLAWSPGKLDNWIDTAGYAACGADCVIAAGLADISELAPTSASPVDPPAIALHVPEDFDPYDPVDIVRLLQQMPGINEPEPHKVMQMTVNEYAHATGRVQLLDIIRAMRNEAGGVGWVDPDERSVGDALRSSIPDEEVHRMVAENVDIEDVTPPRTKPRRQPTTSVQGD